MGFPAVKGPIYESIRREVVGVAKILGLRGKVKANMAGNFQLVETNRPLPLGVSAKYEIKY